MKSSNDIRPVVGMVLKFHNDDVGTITEVKGPSSFRGTHGYASDGIAWDGGHYEIIWIPPTDEERQMFRDAAVGWRNRRFVEGWSFIGNDSFDYGGSWNDVAEICESLAMDGM